MRERTRRSAFAAVVRPSWSAGTDRGAVHRYLLKIPRVIVIVADPESKEHRLVLLNGKDKGTQLLRPLELSPVLICASPSAQLPTELREVLRRDDVPLVEHSVHFSYEYWSAGEPQSLPTSSPAHILWQTRSSKRHFPRSCSMNPRLPSRKSGISVSFLAIPFLCGADQPEFSPS